MKFYPRKFSTIALLSSISTLAIADYVDMEIIDANRMSNVGFSLQGIGATLIDNTYQFPEKGHYCSAKTIFGEFKAGDNISIKLDANEAFDNRLSLRLLGWGPDGYKGFGGRVGHAELTGNLPFDVSRISVGFCRYNNNDFDSFVISKFNVVHTKEVIVQAQEKAPEPRDQEIPVYPACREYSNDKSGQVIVLDDSEPNPL